MQNSQDGRAGSFNVDAILARSTSMLTDNGGERNRNLMDNFEILEIISIGPFSITYKIQRK